MILKLKDADGLHQVDVKNQGDRMTLKLDSRSLEVEVSARPPAGFVLRCGDRTQVGYTVRNKDWIYLQLGGKSWIFKDVTNEESAGSGADMSDGDNRVMAPMPGSVIKLLVAEGDQVTRNQPLVIVEAMKMENEVRSPINGRVGKIRVTPGKQVGFGEILLDLAPLETAGDTN